LQSTEAHLSYRKPPDVFFFVVRTTIHRCHIDEAAMGWPSLRCSPIKVVCNPSPSPLLPIPLPRRHFTLSVPLSFLLNAASQARSPLPSACTRRRRRLPSSSSVSPSPTSSCTSSALSVRRYASSPVRQGHHRSSIALPNVLVKQLWCCSAPLASDACKATCFVDLRLALPSAHVPARLAASSLPHPCRARLRPPGDLLLLHLPSSLSG
jgi:hypothetical protein